MGNCLSEKYTKDQGMQIMLSDHPNRPTIRSSALLFQVEDWAPHGPPSPRSTNTFSENISGSENSASFNHSRSEDEKKRFAIKEAQKFESRFRQPQLPDGWPTGIDCNQGGHDIAKEVEQQVNQIQEEVSLIQMNYIMNQVDYLKARAKDLSSSDH